MHLPLKDGDRGTHSHFLDYKQPIQTPRVKMPMAGFLTNCYIVTFNNPLHFLTWRHPPAKVVFKNPAAGDNLPSLGVQANRLEIHSDCGILLVSVMILWPLWMIALSMWKLVSYLTEMFTQKDPELLDLLLRSNA